MMSTLSRSLGIAQLMVGLMALACVSDVFSHDEESTREGDADSGVDSGAPYETSDSDGTDDGGTENWLPPAEACGNELDDDGDGEVDEGCSCTMGEERACYDGDPSLAGVGVCVQGVQVCEPISGVADEFESAEWGPCVGAVGPSPSGEQCDDLGLDEDCDGEVDEDCLPVERPWGRCEVRCTGAEHVLYNAEYDVWIQIVLCSPERFDLLMGESETGPFYKIGDTGGHGQDHCELVNPTFTIPIDDDINSGTCSTCAVEGAGSISGIPELLGTPMYFRSRIDEPFEFTPAADHWGIHTSCWYECGVSF